MSRGTGRGSTAKKAEEPKATLETLTRKVDELTASVRAGSTPTAADVRRLRWWTIAMAAVSVAALAVAATAVVMLSTNG